MSFAKKCDVLLNNIRRAVCKYIYINNSNNIKRGPELLKSIKLSFACMSYPWKVPCFLISFVVGYCHFQCFIDTSMYLLEHYTYTLHIFTSPYGIEKNFLKKDYSILCISSF